MPALSPADHANRVLDALRLHEARLRTLRATLRQIADMTYDSRPSTDAMRAIHEMVKTAIHDLEALP